MAITRYVKFGEEDEFGEEAEEFSETIDPETASIDPEDEDKLIYEGIGGLDRKAGLGVYSTAGEITVPLDDQATGWLWKWALGGYEKESGEEEDSTTHIFFPAQSALMDSFSAKIGKDIMEHVFLGNVIESIELEVEDEWALMSVSTLGAKDKKSSLDDDIEYTDGMLFSAPMASLSKDDSAYDCKVNSLTLSIETGADVETTQGFGSRFPCKAFRGSLVVELEMELGFDSVDELIAFWGDNDGPSTSTITEIEHVLSFGDAIDISFPRMVYTGSEQPAEGRDGITQSITARALYDDDKKEGPVIVSLTNDRESY